ncbi:hypothetical protein E8P82_04060 [Arthrobacter echini]|uniref:Glycosyl hydrolase family 98 putative carbohydrate-binding module domain-containing protein n=1 Tax=Arthrobacter echini TaxID=1529066 RepID=A0A4S5E8W8_9MICC|nr:hypothetical protein [Arthrobacter echini]THJ68002.1 hypothetical protein E8P82_04060 [Arthrobacter echini]
MLEDEMKATPAILLVAAALTLSACSTADEPSEANGSAAASPAPTSSLMPSEPVVPSTSPSSSSAPPASTSSPDSSAPSPSPSPEGEGEELPESEDQESGAPTVPTGKAGATLGLADFFEPSSDWEENRYEVAGEANVSGISAEVSGHDESQAERLELRLANNFDRLDFTVGQANDSSSSDQTMVVQVLGNNKQLDVQQVPFNAQQPISVDVSGVNAVVINFYLEDSSTYGSVNAVLSDITAE